MSLRFAVAARRVLPAVCCAGTLFAAPPTLAGTRYTAIASDMSGRTVTLTGHDLSIDQIVMVARHGARVALSDDARRREADNYGLLLEASAGGIPVYWFNRGSGGAAMVGAGEAYYQGVRMPADQALKRAGLAPIQPFAADDNALTSSNAYATGQAALLVHDAREALEWADVIYAIDLNGMNSSITPLSLVVQHDRPEVWLNWHAARILDMCARPRMRPAASGRCRRRRGRRSAKLCRLASRPTSRVRSLHRTCLNRVGRSQPLRQTS